MTRKYHETVTTDDLKHALDKVAADAHAQVQITLRPTVSSQVSLIVRVEFRAIGMALESDPVHVYQEAVDTRRKLELASVLHRILYVAWASYHSTPWAWTGGMRRAHVRSEA